MFYRINLIRLLRACLAIKETPLRSVRKNGPNLFLSNFHNNNYILVNTSKVYHIIHRISTIMQEHVHYILVLRSRMARQCCLMHKKNKLRPFKSCCKNSSSRWKFGISWCLFNRSCCNHNISWCELHMSWCKLYISWCKLHTSWFE